MPENGNPTDCNCKQFLVAQITADIRDFLKLFSDTLLSPAHSPGKTAVRVVNKVIRILHPWDNTVLPIKVA